jgi:hypothetical protein
MILQKTLLPSAWIQLAQKQYGPAGYLIQQTQISGLALFHHKRYSGAAQ